MSGQIISIVVGFVLTTVIGGAFASYLQQRSWQQRRLLWAIIGRSENRMPEEQVKQRLSDYELVLFEWNDKLNTRLAIVGAYFGRDVRDCLDRVIYGRFQEAGRTLETLYRQVMAILELHVGHE